MRPGVSATGTAGSYAVTRLGHWLTTGLGVLDRADGDTGFEDPCDSGNSRQVRVIQRGDPIAVRPAPS